jgi:hypothetical protein
MRPIAALAITALLASGALALACTAGTASGSDAGVEGGASASDATAGSDSPFGMPANACSTSANGCICLPGGGTVGGGGKCPGNVTDCTTDKDCALIDDAAPPKPMVCLPGAGNPGCPGGMSGLCIPSCNGGGTMCGVDQACGSQGLCVAKPCSSDGDCPMNGNAFYACTQGACAGKSCMADGDCGAGNYCIDNHCYNQAGMCAGLAP